MNRLKGLVRKTMVKFNYGVIGAGAGGRLGTEPEGAWLEWGPVAEAG